MTQTHSSGTTRSSTIKTWIKHYQSRVLLWVRLLITIGLMAFVLSLVGSNEEKLRNVDWTLIPVAWLLMLIATAIKAYRWGLLVRQSHLDLSFRRLLGSYLVGSFFSTVLPTSVGGDAVRAVDTATSSGRIADSTSSVLIERGIGLLAVIGSGSLFAMFMDPGKVPLSFVLMLHALFIGGLIGIVVLRQGWFISTITGLMTKFKLGKMANKVWSLSHAMSGHLGRPAVLGEMLLLSLAANALTMSGTYLVLVAVDKPISLASFVPMISLITAAELLPISIASLGVKESAYIFFLGLAGVSSGSAGVVAIIMRVLTWGHALLGGIVYLGRTLGNPVVEEAS